jgi:ATP-dependent exoDNAse (exonuclease V) alpha subunit
MKLLIILYFQVLLYIKLLIQTIFPVNSRINQVVVEKIITYFNMNGVPAQRTQFPLQNAFELTVHKTQGLTLPHTTISLDEQMFTNDKTYVAMSHAKSWKI